MNITGKLRFKSDVIQISETFKKREFVIDLIEGDQGQYINPIQLELIQDKCEILDQFKIGQDLSVEFNLRGRDWINDKGETRYFNSLQAWKVSVVDSQGSSGSDFAVSSEVAEDGIPF
jgi:hypothetical protein